MELAARFIALARKDLPLLDYAIVFSQLAVLMAVALIYNTSGPRAQPTITPLRGAKTAHARCDQRAIAEESNRAEDQPGTRASRI
ncbi:hypothetical protein M9458_025817, partial [Cirrhinus mrigala]